MCIRDSSLENHLPAAGFDVLAFNLSAELVYTNVLNLIDLSGVPVRAAARTADHPLVVAGGHCAFNPEPLADFVDCFVLGDGEEAVGEVNEVIAAWKAAGAGGGTAGDPTGREDLLRALAGVPGVYAPACYEARFDAEPGPRPGGGASAPGLPRLVEIVPRFPEAPPRVEKRTIADLGQWPYPKQQLVPLIEVVHDRLNVEPVSYTHLDVYKRQASRRPRPRRATTW